MGIKKMDKKKCGGRIFGKFGIYASESTCSRLGGTSGRRALRRSKFRSCTVTSSPEESIGWGIARDQTAARKMKGTASIVRIALRMTNANCAKLNNKPPRGNKRRHVICPLYMKFTIDGAKQRFYWASSSARECPNSKVAQVIVRSSSGACSNMLGRRARRSGCILSIC